MTKQFKATHLFFPSITMDFTEDTAPDWITSRSTVVGSTVDSRWFWTDCILTLEVGCSVDTDFYTIERIE